MKLIEIILQATKDADGFPIVTGSIEIEGVTRQIKRRFNRGYLMDPLYKTFIEEIAPLEDATVVLLTNIKKFADDIRDIETTRKYHTRKVRRIARINKLTILAKQIK